MLLTDLIGDIASFFIISCYIPQIVVLISNKNVENISIPMYILLSIAQCLSVIYVILLDNNIQIILTNVISGVFTLFIIMYCIVNKHTNTIHDTRDLSI